jgi:ubiquinone biosynthesis protein UbiJ
MTAPAGASSEAPDVSGRSAYSLPNASEKGLQAVLAALNHLLAADERARASLQSHAGRLIRFRISSSDRTRTWLTVRAVITPLGTLQPQETDPGQEADVTMTVQPSIDAAFALLQQGPAGLQSHLRIEGDVLLAAALGEISRSLRWEVEEDLSRVMGDVLAHRLVGLAGAAFSAFREFGDRVGAGFARHWSVEDPVLVTRIEMAGHSADLSSLVSRLSALERRGGVRR